MKHDSDDSIRKLTSEQGRKLLRRYLRRRGVTQAAMLLPFALEDNPDLPAKFVQTISERKTEADAGLTEPVEWTAMKRCTRCQKCLPATPQNFNRDRGRLHSWCKSCARANAKSWRHRNPERVRAQQRAWRAAHLESERARGRASYHKHREKRLAYAKAAREANPEKHRDANRRSYWKHHDTRLSRIRAYSRTEKAKALARVRALTYYYRHRAERLAYLRQYRATHSRTRSEPIKKWASKYERDQASKLRRKYGITLGEFRAMLRHQGGLCAICGQPETRCVNSKVSGRVAALSLDHSHSTGQVRGVLCHSCNHYLRVVYDEHPRQFLRTLQTRQAKDGLMKHVQTLRYLEGAYRPAKSYLAA